MTDDAEQNGSPRFHSTDVLKREQAWSDYLRRIVAGDASGLELLYDETHLSVYNVVQFILSNVSDAEEIVLDVYAYIWRSADAYNPHRGTVLAWLIMLGRSRALDRLRSRAAAKRKGTEVQCTENFIATGPSQFAVDIEQRISIQRILKQLSCEDLELIQLAFYSGFSHRELALKLQTPLGTIKTRIRTALSQLRGALSQGQLDI